MAELSDYGVPGLVQWLSLPPGSSHSALNSKYISPKLEIRSNDTSGRGVYAVDEISAGETLVRIPHSFLMNSNTILKHISHFNGREKVADLGYSVVLPSELKVDEIAKAYSDISLSAWHELTAFQRTGLFLCLEKRRKDNSFWKPFLASLPKIEELNLCPLVWEVESETTGSDAVGLTKWLPKSAQKHAKRVLERFNTDYKVVHDFLQPTSVQQVEKMEFLWAWICINSRCLYMSFPSTKSAADNFTLAPYVDFFNHDCEERCEIKIDSRGFLVVSRVKQQAEKELFFSYGPHSNEFLLCEYAFTMESNRWNNVDVSHHIEGIMNETQAEYLREQGYLGDYTISENGGISFRTQVALAAVQEREPALSRRLNLLIQGYNDGDAYKPVSRNLMNRILKEIVDECKATKPKLVPQNSVRVQQIVRLYLDMEHIANVTLANLELW